jgi:hypothetical protein
MFCTQMLIECSRFQANTQNHNNDHQCVPMCMINIKGPIFKSLLLILQCYTKWQSWFTNDDLIKDLYYKWLTTYLGMCIYKFKAWRCHGAWRTFDSLMKYQPKMYFTFCSFHIHLKSNTNHLEHYIQTLKTKSQWIKTFQFWIVKFNNHTCNYVHIHEKQRGWQKFE